MVQMSCCSHMLIYHHRLVTTELFTPANWCHLVTVLYSSLSVFLSSDLGDLVDHPSDPGQHEGGADTAVQVERTAVLSELGSLIFSIHLIGLLGIAEFLSQKAAFACRVCFAYSDVRVL